MNAGFGTTQFGKFLDRGLKAIGHDTAGAAVRDAGIDTADIEAAWAGNAAALCVTILEGLGHVRE